jgi:gliding motility-associated-like protein
MHRWLLYSISLVFMSVPLAAQVSFFKTLGTNNTDVGTDLITTQNNGYALLMQSPFDAPLNSRVNMGLVITNSSGNPISTHELMVDSSCVGAKIMEWSNGDFYILGTATYSSFFNTNKLFLLKTNNTGLPIWCYQYQLSASDQAVDITKTSDGNMLILGTSSYNIWYEELMVLKVTPAGDVLWAKNIQYPAHEILGSNIKQFNNGDIAIAATSSANSFNDMVIIRLDAAGNLLWQKQYSTPYDDEVAKITVTESNEIYATGNSVSIATAWDFYITKIDPNGQLQFANFYDAGTYNGEKTRDMEHNSNGITIVGDLGTFDERNVFLTHLDFNGNIIWAKQYPYMTSFTNYPYGLEIVQNNQYAFTADVYTSIASREAGLIKTDATGDAGCYTANANFNLIPMQFVVSEIPLVHSTVEPIKSSRLHYIIPNNIVPKTLCEHIPPIAWVDTTASHQDCPFYCFTFVDSSLNNPTQWSWSFEGGTPATSVSQNPDEICWKNDGVYEIKLVVENEFGTDSTIFNLQISTGCPLQIPNVFTTNNDGTNDVFEIKGLPENFELMIYNRWGEIVFYSTTPTNMWNGKIGNNGSLASPGVYYYVLIDETNQKKYSSFLHVFH